MLLGNELKEDGSRWRMEEVVEWSRQRGLVTSIAALSRHKNNHLNPAIQAALETERMVEAISAATGRKLSVARAYANAVLAKTLRVLDSLAWDELDPDQQLRAITQGLRAGEVLSKLERADVRVEVAERVEKTLSEAGVNPEILRKVREVYGLET
jgi:glutathione S-transferase